MNHIRRGLSVFAFMFITVVIGLLPGAQAGAQTGGGEIVAFHAGPSGLVWRPLVPFEHGLLTVAGPDGTVFREEFGAGASPAFNPFVQPGYHAEDGTYIWEVRLGRPSAVHPQLRAAAKAARESGDAEVEAAHRAASERATKVQSGAFQILNGTIVPSDLVEPRGTARGRSSHGVAPAFRLTEWLDDPSVRPVDQVIPDDLIVQGSACIGLDCVNNETFGFDTIRLKENNTRIQFDDTSTAAGFPTNNWQIRANSSASGGASFLGFVDQGASGNSETGTIVFEVDAGAPANSLKVSSAGKVGLRTATPVLDLHLTTSDTPAHRLEQTSAGGFTAQTWDVAGNEANFFVRDVTGGSRLPFRIRPGAPTSSIDINASGIVGMGTASPLVNLDVRGANAKVQVGSDTAAAGFGPTQSGYGISNTTEKALFGVGTGLGFVGTNSNTSFALLTNNSSRVTVTGAGNVGIGTTTPTAQLELSTDSAKKPTTNTWTITSDARVKTVQRPFADGLSVIRRIDPVWYRYNGRGGFVEDGEHVGIIAQDLLPVAPYMIGKDQRALDPGGPVTDVYTYQGHALAFVAANAIKELDAEVKALRAKIAELEARISSGVIPSSAAVTSKGGGM